MIEQKVIVTSATDNYLLLKPISTGCDSCKQTSCGAAGLATLFGKRDRSLRAVNPGGIAQNDELVLLIDESLFLRTVFAQYLLPLVVVLISLLFASSLTQSTYVQVTVGFISLFVGIMISRYMVRKLESHISGKTFQLRKSESAGDSRITNVQLLTS